ncbi:protein-cysteine N-palmitoyltransferase Rasp-like isoform X2 [Haemaphysalis longicornis]
MNSQDIRVSTAPGNDFPLQRCPLRIFNWVAWIGIVAYTLWCYATCDVNTSVPKKLDYMLSPSPYGFTKPWDNTEQEWREGRHFLLMAWPWLLGYTVTGRILSHTLPWLVPYFHVVSSLLFLALKLGPLVPVFFLLEHALFYGLVLVGVPLVVYIVGVALVAHYNIFEFDIFRIVLERYGGPAYFVTVVAFFWTVLRCCSFSLESIWSQASTGDNKRHRRMPHYLKTLDYVMYLPPLFMGPVQNYEDYTTAMEAPKPMPTLQELTFLVAGFFRSSVHFVLMDFMLHVFYTGALTNAPYMVEKLDLTSLLGYGIMLNIFFYMKYLIQYGMSRNFARIECLELPAPAKCVGRGHLCSHFWRYFDHGLHLWIKKYVYLPLTGTERKYQWRLAGIALAFLFVWVWHGMTVAVSFWAFLSFVGVSVEVVVAMIRKLEPVKNFEAEYLNSERTRIIKAVLGSPHYLLTIFSCMFYLTGMEVMAIFWRKVILGFPVPIVPLLVALYFGSHASIDTMEWEAADAARCLQRQQLQKNNLGVDQNCGELRIPGAPGKC